ncbi:MAG: ABC transporter permease [Eubacteriales bacterium]|nr:ABC transporter permease [Eubacteriales bacterium]
MWIMESIKLALSSIKANRMRSFLTMLGVIIGIGSVIAISAIGSSAKGVISDSLEANGLGYMYIMPSYELNGGFITDAQLFKPDEMERLSERMGDELVYVAPYGNTSGSCRNGRTTADINLNGVGAGYFECVPSITIVEGRELNEADIKKDRNVIVIPVEMAEKFFGNQRAVGKNLMITVDDNLTEFTVVGTYTETKTKLEALFGGAGRFTAYIPYTFVTGVDFIAYYLECYVDSPNVQETGDKMAAFLARIKRLPENAFMCYSTQSEMNQVNSILDILSLAIGAIAAISLLVGGIGIMNIMLVSVTERTREIGIRKALGARTGDILWQFLIEAMILSVIGGIAGILLGVGIAGIAAKILDARLIIEPTTIVISVVFSALVGMVFGIFPARKAAKKDPIEALRYE